VLSYLYWTGSSLIPGYLYRTGSFLIPGYLYWTGSFLTPTPRSDSVSSAPSSHR
jgi:hypothetical protein